MPGGLPYAFSIWHPAQWPHQCLWAQAFTGVSWSHGHASNSVWPDLCWKVWKAAECLCGTGLGSVVDALFWVDFSWLPFMLSSVVFVLFEVVTDHTIVKPVKPKFWLVGVLTVPAHSSVKLEWAAQAWAAILTLRGQNVLALNHCFNLKFTRARANTQRGFKGSSAADSGFRYFCLNL